MKKTILCCALTLGALYSLAAALPADTAALPRYRRSTLFTVALGHPSLKYGPEILGVFDSMPVPDKFDSLSLASVGRVVILPGEAKEYGLDREDFARSVADTFLVNNAVGRHLVARWFNRDERTGCFDMLRVADRGNYDASLADVRLARMTARGTAALADAGEELIGNTFVMVNDITYIDKQERTKKAGGWLRFAGSVVDAFAPGAGELASSAADITESFSGFSVRISSFLYRLRWDEPTAATFYDELWNDASGPDSLRRAAFDAADSLFRLDYVGATSVNAGNVVFGGITSHSEADQIRIVCTRALDRAVVELQRRYDEFKVRVPVMRVDDDGSVWVEIGLKEGVGEKSRYEVLQPVEKESGGLEYRRVATLTPVKGKIWDNRFMAAEEAEAIAAARAAGKKVEEDKETRGTSTALTATCFRRTGGRVYPGYLVREIK